MGFRILMGGTILIICGRLIINQGLVSVLSSYSLWLCNLFNFYYLEKDILLWFMIGKVLTMNLRAFLRMTKPIFCLLGLSWFQK